MSYPKIFTLRPLFSTSKWVGELFGKTLPPPMVKSIGFFFKHTLEQEHCISGSKIVYWTRYNQYRPQNELFLLFRMLSIIYGATFDFSGKLWRSQLFVYKTAFFLYLRNHSQHRNSMHVKLFAINSRSFYTFKIFGGSAVCLLISQNMNKEFQPQKLSPS